MPIQEKINIYFWFGNDDFSKLELLRSEKTRMLLKNRNADINDFDFAETDNRFELENRVKGALKGSSLFSSDKLTVVRNFWSSQRRARKKAEEKNEKAGGNSESVEKKGFEDFFLGYLGKINAGDRLFFLETRDLDKRGRAYKSFEELSKSDRLEKKEFALPLGFKFNVWLEERLQLRGGNMSKNNLDLLAMLLGKGMEQKERSGEMIAAYDLYQAAGEIDKLIAYADGQEITKEDIMLLVSASSDMNIFNLIESIGRRDKDSAISILSGQIQEGFNENYILTMLVYHFRNLISVKSLLGENLSSSEISKVAKMHPMVAEKSIKYARTMKEENLVLIYEKLYSVDVSIKTGKMDPELALDILIAAI